MIEQNEKIILNRVKLSLGGYALGDIQKSISLVGEKNMHIGSFILCSCFIDQVSAFYYGMKVLKPRKRSILNSSIPSNKFCTAPFVFSRVSTQVLPFNMIVSIKKYAKHGHGVKFV